MTEKEELLVILMEECSEVIQEASKLIRFDDTDPDRIEKETGDLLCMIELMREKGVINSSLLTQHIDAKREKLKQWSSLHIE
jgi:NTP pyrophosphatase (non-canonical NTP hydrolase)